MSRIRCQVIAYEVAHFAVLCQIQGGHLRLAQEGPHVFQQAWVRVEEGEKGRIVALKLRASAISVL